MDNGVLINKSVEKVVLVVRNVCLDVELRCPLSTVRH